MHDHQPNSFDLIKVLFTIYTVQTSNWTLLNHPFISYSSSFFTIWQTNFKHSERIRFK